MFSAGVSLTISSNASRVISSFRVALTLEYRAEMPTKAIELSCAYIFQAVYIFWTCDDGEFESFSKQYTIYAHNAYIWNLIIKKISHL